MPWRRTTTPYRILVSEVMLQQTQVDRVIPYYKKFLKKFPNAQALADAPLGEVLRAWSGLGYNRRAKMLHNAAKEITIYDNFPRDYKTLVSLPGVGEYTAKAVRVFAYNEPEVLVETNVRTVFIHHFFPRTKRKISDEALVRYIVQTLDTKNPRAWYAALMDYGTYLKQTHGNVSQKSKSYVKQKPLKGSNREIRGALLKALTKKPQARATLSKLPFEKEKIKTQLAALEKEKIIKKVKSVYALP